MSVQIIPSESFSGQSIFSKPKLKAVFTRCLPLGTGRISPAKLNSPTTAVLSGNGIEVRAEYKDDENEITKVFAISRTQWADLNR